MKRLSLSCSIRELQGSLFAMSMAKAAQVTPRRQNEAYRCPRNALRGSETVSKGKGRTDFEKLEIKRSKGR